jgi:hypothetical protein
MNKFLFSLLLISSPVILTAQVPNNTKGPLDGKTFTVDTYKEGKKKPLDADELKFALGKFKSKYFADWGFTKASKYQIISVDSTSGTKTYSWTAETTSDIKETMTWSGTITGEEIEGTSEIVNDKGKQTYSFTFSGKLKGKPAKK